MLARFDSPTTPARWASSSERQWWLRSAQGLAEMTRTERRTGIEGWFDPPIATEPPTGDDRPVPVVPPRWKQAVVIWSVFFPLNLLAAVTLGRWLADVHVVLRVMTTTLVLTPVMTDSLECPFG